MSSENSTKVINIGFVRRFIDLMETDEPAVIQQKLGIDYQSAKNYLSGRKPRAEVLEKIADKTGVSINWLLTGKGRKIIVDSLSERDISTIEKLRRSWNANKSDDKSFDDFLKTIIIWGEVGIRSDEIQANINSQFQTLEYTTNRDFLLSRSIVEIIKQEMLDGHLREVIIDVVQEEFFEAKEQISEEDRQEFIKRLKQTRHDEVTFEGESTEEFAKDGGAVKSSEIVKTPRKKKAI